MLTGIGRTDLVLGLYLLKVAAVLITASLAYFKNRIDWPLYLLIVGANTVILTLIVQLIV